MMPESDFRSRADCLAELRAQLPPAEAESEAWEVLDRLLGLRRADLLAFPQREVTPAQWAQVGAVIQRRRAGEPLAYVLGRRGFWSLDLRVSPATLIPRVETERLVELALQRLPADRALRVADLGTGSGAVALALARERPKALILASDLSRAALQVASQNAAEHRIGNVAFVRADWLQAYTGQFDLIASNPPYLWDDDAHLDQGDLRHEPRSALASGADGLDAIRDIVAEAPRVLLPGGWLLIEHGRSQGAAVRDLLRAAGLVEVATEVDLEQRDRVSLGRRSPG